MGGKRVHVFVSGKVQGVWFRDSTRQEAERLGVSGWVRNLEDGRVEGVFEGRPGAVDALVVWCGRGPDGARVDGVQVTEEAPTGELGNFHITG